MLLRRIAALMLFLLSSGAASRGGRLVRGSIITRSRWCDHRFVSSSAFQPHRPAASRQRRTPTRHTAAQLPTRSMSATTPTTINSTNKFSRLENDARGRRLTQDMLARVRQVNGIDDDEQNEIRRSLVPFAVDGVRLGQVRPAVAERLCSIGGVFAIVDDDDNSNQCLTLNNAAAGTTYESRTAAVAKVMEVLKEDGTIAGWRDELFPVAPNFYSGQSQSQAVLAVERAAVPFLGATEYGVHVNGLVVVDSDSADLQMWIARRAADKSKWPGYLDHIVAGGQPVGLSLTENVVKECWEEAGIPEDLARAGLRPAGVVSYERYAPQKDVVEQVVLFNYDLYLPADFVPKPVDGEVQEFFLWTMDELIDSMALDYPDPVKPNCHSVIIDFLLRHGYLNPEIDGYLDIQRELRGGLCR